MERMTKHDKAVCRLYDLLSLQNEIAKQYGESGYNIFIFGSYLTTDFVEGQSDIDIATVSYTHLTAPTMSIFSFWLRLV